MRELIAKLRSLGEEFPNRLAINIIGQDDDRLPMRSRTRWKRGKRGSKKGVDV